ncbi:MAG: accessory gene regulator B family protein, partial [Clostridia bacterium]|nr:accessory gene regulator B family protein [Clostridia bacterium]
ILIYLWIPAGTDKKEIKNKSTRQKIKRTSLVISTFWILLVVYSFISQFYHQYILASTLGVFSAFFFVTPLAYKMTKCNYKLRRG